MNECVDIMVSEIALFLGTTTEVRGEVTPKPPEQLQFIVAQVPEPNDFGEGSLTKGESKGPSCGPLE